jgi:hypothetical protein
MNGYLQSTNKVQQRFYLACGLLLVVFLVNDIVARYLFSVGNPYSLVALLFFATPTRLLGSALNASQYEGASNSFAGILTSRTRLISN